MSFIESTAETLPPSFRSKVIIRNLRLFDTTSSSNIDGDSSVDRKRKSEAEEEFKSSIQNWIADIEHFQYYHSSPTSQLQPLSLPWATVQFKTRKALISFKNSYSLSNSIEYSIVQPIASSNAVVDPIANTIEEDQDFIDFVNRLKLCNDADADDGSVIGNETTTAATSKADDNGSALYEKMMKEKQIRKEKEVFHGSRNNGSSSANSSTKNNTNTTNANLNNKNNKNRNKNKNNKNKKKPEKEERKDEVKINVHQPAKSKFTIAKRDFKETTAKEITMKGTENAMGDSATKQKAKKDKKEMIEKSKKPKVKKDPKKAEVLIKAKPDDKSVLSPHVQIKPQIKPTPTPTPVPTPQETKPKIYTRASKNI